MAPPASFRPVKYLPSIDFKEPRKPVAPKVEDLPPPPPTFSEEELAAARAEAYAEGRAAGLATARGEIAADIAALEQRLAETMHAIAQGLTANGEQLKIGAARLGLAVGRTLAAVLMRETPLAEIEQIVLDCFEELKEEPRVVIQTHPERMDELRGRVEEIAERTAFPAKLIFIDDMNMADSDIRIEWAHGGAAWEAAKLDEAVSAAVDRFIATRDERENEES